MIPRDCNRLAEVDFPIAAVSRQAAREKSIRQGHPSTLHLWWARRPLAACRSMLLALLLPDPCDSLCPPDFKDKARTLLRGVLGRTGSEDRDLREALLRFVGEFSNWDNASNPTFIEVARGLIKAAYPDEMPLVVDPFAGGGSIPLEALRLGCDAFASDLNPVACLILKVVLQDIPRHKSDLGDELRRVGADINATAEKLLAQYYPADPDGSLPIAYLWARTIQCEAPNCGAEIPLVRSFWLSKKAGKALRFVFERRDNAIPRIAFEIFSPKEASEVPRGTVARARATCPCCGSSLEPERVRSQLRGQRGGADAIFDSDGQRVGGARLLAVITRRQGESGSRYRLSSARDYTAAYAAFRATAHVDSLPNEQIPLTELRRISIPLYGSVTWGDVYTARQKLALATLTKILRGKSDKEISDAARRALALCVSRMANAHTSFSRWHQTRETVEGIFSRQAVGMVWDFCEGNPFSKHTGSVSGSLDWVAGVIESAPMTAPAQVEQADASKLPLPDQCAAVWFTDPPYYDAVPYAHLADLFYVWLKRIIGDQQPKLFESALTPKDAECVVDRPHSSNKDAKTPAQYETKMASAMLQGRLVIQPDGIGGIVFAHKTTKGWEALLSGILQSRWIITASWPITTEMAARNTARDTAALSASIHLVCRPRIEDKVGDWAEVLRELPIRVSDWMVRLETEGVHGADLVFACIGPALEIFSRYSRVETPDGRQVGLPEYLEKVWEVVGRAALEQVLGTAEAEARNGGLGALEEDSRLTALFLWTLGASDKGAEPDGSDLDTEEEDEESEDDGDEGQSSRKAKGLTLIYDIVRRFAQPLGIHLDAWESRIIHTQKGVVRLLPVAERAMQLFGEAGADAMASAIENDPRKAAQLELFPAKESDTQKIKGRGRKKAATSATTAYVGQVTTLDRVHAAMLLQRQGRTNALRSLLAAEAQRGSDFSRLANALSALYPPASEEKRLLDAMLLAMPRR